MVLERKGLVMNIYLFLQSVIHNRILQKMSTFVGVIVLKRAFDVVNRYLMWWKLKHAGSAGKFLRILQGLYQDIKYAVRVCGRSTEWFPTLAPSIRTARLVTPLFIEDIQRGPGNENLCKI